MYDIFLFCCKLANSVQIVSIVGIVCFQHAIFKLNSIISMTY